MMQLLILTSVFVFFPFLSLESIFLFFSCSFVWKTDLSLLKLTYKKLVQEMELLNHVHMRN